MRSRTLALLRGVVIITTVLALFLAGLLAFEALRVSRMTDAEAQREYHFGAEAMLVHGGPSYQSRDTYQAYVYKHLGIASGASLILVLITVSLRKAARPDATRPA